MNKLILVNPNINGIYLIPDLYESFSIIFDTNVQNWKNILQKTLGNLEVNKCQLFCLFGSEANEAEDLVDDWLISIGNERAFFPTIADTDIDEIWHTIQTKIIILLTSDYKLIRSIAQFENN